MRVTRFAVVGVLVGAMACSSSSYGSYGPTDYGGDTPAANQVFMQNTAFSPTSQTVTAGTAVTWVNKDGFAHTTTSSPGSTQSWDSNNLGGSATFLVTFSTPGTYPYYCKLHGTPNSGMRGTIIVQ